MECPRSRHHRLWKFSTLLLVSSDALTPLSPLRSQIVLAQSRDCASVLRNLKIECAISRLVHNFRILRMCSAILRLVCNFWILRMRSAISRLRIFLNCTEQIHYKTRKWKVEEAGIKGKSWAHSQWFTNRGVIVSFLVLTNIWKSGFLFLAHRFLLQNS